MQAQADLLQVPIEVYPSAHATPLGAASLARFALTSGGTLAESLWPWTPDEVYEPTWSADRAADFLARWRVAAAATLPEKGTS
jgi:glycerol kinase